MDPEALLKAAAALATAGELGDARELIDAYWEWRDREGFEPHDGDKRARTIKCRIDGKSKKIKKKRYRAIKWRRSSDQVTVVGKWHTKRSEALKDAYADYAPHKRAFYEIESNDGKRKDLTERQYITAQNWYADAIRARDARGVWG